MGQAGERGNLHLNLEPELRDIEVNGFCDITDDVSHSCHQKNIQNQQNARREPTVGAVGCGLGGSRNMRLEARLPPSLMFT